MDFSQERYGISNVSNHSSKSTKVQTLRIRGGYNSASSNYGPPKVKFMSSSGGKILPRPSDMKLRYVGGETRMISVLRNICYSDLYGKMTEIYGPQILLKYQLPEEDLDALVSVSSDEDLENMLEEYDRLNYSEGFSRLRMFVFQETEDGVVDLQDLSDPKSSEQKFVDALNDASFDLPWSRININFINAESHSDSFLRSWDDGIQLPKNDSISSSNYDKGLLAMDHNRDLLSFDHTANPDRTSVDKIEESIFFNELPPGNLCMTENKMHFAVTDADNFCNLERGASTVSSDFSQQQGHLDFHDKKDIPNSEMEIQKSLSQYESEKHDTSCFENVSVEYQNFWGNASMQHQNGSDGRIQGDDLPDPPLPQLNRTSLLDTDLVLGVDMENHLSSDGSAHLNDVDLYTVENPFHEKYALQERHVNDGLSTTDSCIILDQETEPVNQLESKHFYTQGYALNDVQFLTQSKPAASFLTSSLTSSTQEQDIGSTRNLELFGNHEHEEGSTIDLSSLDSTVQASTQTVPIVNWQIQGQPLERMTQEKIGVQLVHEPHDTSDTNPYSFFSPNNILQDGSVDHNIYQKSVSPNGLGQYSDDELSSITLIAEQLSKLETNDDTKEILAAPERHNSEGGWPSNDYTMPENITLYAVLSQDKRMLEHNDSVGSYTEENHRVSGLPTESSTGNSFLIRLQDELPQQASGGLGLESVIARVDSFNLLASLQQTESENPSFHSIQSSLYSREHFDKMATTFASAFNNETIFRGGQHLPRSTAMVPVKVSPLASLIETWEASLLRDEIEQPAPAVDMNANEVEPSFDDDATAEDFNVELEELDEFKSFDYGPSNVVTAAEVEAITRGLQTIRNIDLEELRELGSGTFGTVYHGKWRGTDVAIKRIKASCFSGRQNERERLMADFWKEACLLSQLHHPNVVAFYGIVPDGPGGTLATVTEYMANGSLKHVLRSKDRTLDRRKRLLIAMDAAFGMEYLHGKNVVHFDIKCENLLVNLRDTQRPICKVGDLGLSKVKQQTFVSGGVRGTLPWMAPELLNGSSSLVSEKVDVFSFGIVMWELLTGEEPYANMHYGAIIGGIVNNTLRPLVPRLCDPAWKSLMEKCWAADPASRPTFLEIARSLRAMEASLTLRGQGQAFLL